MAVQSLEIRLDGDATNTDIDSVPSRITLLKRSLELWVPAGFLLIMALACFVWPVVHSVPNPIRGNLSQPLVPPLSRGHLLGTDQLGNDVFSRILYGGRVSFEVGFGATALGLVIGGAAGAYATLRGGALETVVMRVLDVFLAFPSLVLAILVAAYLGPSEIHVIWAISFFSIPAFARLARGSTLRLRELNFVLSSQLSGTRPLRILIRHVTPNILPELLTFSLLSIGLAILAEASLSFLGLGVPPPAPSWGNMIAAGQQQLTSSPNLVLIPSAFLFATIVAVNMLGDAVRTRWSAS